MTIEPTLLAAQAIALTMAATGGVFQSFSDFTMRGLAEEGSAGAKGMQGLNRTVLRSVFVVMIFAITPLSMGAAWFAAGSASALSTQLLWLGAGIYTLGVPVVTILGNVPMNERLAVLDAESSEGSAYWQTYLTGWTRWNTLRMWACYVSAVIFSAAVIAA